MIFIHVNDENVDKFNKLSKSHHCFLKYYMPGCGHCVAMEKDWEDMKHHLPHHMRKMNNVIVGEINSSAVPRLTGYNDILGYPTIVYLKNNELKDEYSGERTKDKMLEWIMLHLKNKEQFGGSKKISKSNKKSKSRKHKTNKKSKSRRYKKTHKKYSRK